MPHVIGIVTELPNNTGRLNQVKSLHRIGVQKANYLFHGAPEGGPVHLCS